MFLNKLDENLNQIFKKNNVSGMSVAVTNQKETIYQKGFGVLNAEYPCFLTVPESMYRIASVTKITTGIMIMCLAQKGILNINEPIKNYIPWFNLDSNKADEQITLKSLLSHTSGLPRGKITEGSRDEFTMEQSLKQVLSECTLSSLPSQKIYSYSNIGISLAGLVASVVSGKTYSELVDDYVFKPLGMDFSTFDFHVASTYSFSLPHCQDENGNLKVEHYIRMNTMFRPSGGLYSNVTDLSKLARCILNRGKSDSGEQILSAEFFEQMCTPYGKMPSDDDGEYGLTMRLFKYKNRYLYGHLGQSKPYATSVITDSKTGYGVVFLCNTDCYKLRTEIPYMIFDMLENQ